MSKITIDETAGRAEWHLGRSSWSQKLDDPDDVPPLAMIGGGLALLMVPVVIISAAGALEYMALAVIAVLAGLLLLGGLATAIKVMRGPGGLTHEEAAAQTPGDTQL